jgi:hypothetical protein
MKMKRLILILISCILVGCSSAPVGWGGTHEVILANEKSIAFIYDKLMGGYSAIMADATEHCKKYKKVPYPTTEGRALMTLSTQAFECR